MIPVKLGGTLLKSCDQRETLRTFAVAGNAIGKGLVGGWDVAAGAEPPGEAEAVEAVPEAWPPVPQAASNEHARTTKRRRMSRPFRGKPVRPP